MANNPPQDLSKKTLRLWIDGQCFQTSSALRGIGRYVMELIRAIATHHPNIELQISFNAAMPKAAIAARDELYQWIPPANVFYWQGVAIGREDASGYTPYHRLSELALAHHVACLRPDVALSPSIFEGFTDIAVPYTGAHGHAVPTAAIFYDAIPIRFPKQYLPSPLLKACYKRRLDALQKFDHLLTISKFAKKEATELLAAPATEIGAGLSAEFLRQLGENSDPDALTRLNIGKNYILYVGAADWRKNLHSVVRAFQTLPPHLRNDLKFVIAGHFPDAQKEDLSSLWKALQLTEANLYILGHVTDPTLISLYKGATAVIQPSLMEGFGLTALEAMACGTPVIAADAGALPEVIGNKLSLFDPTNVASISHAIARVADDTEYRAQLVRHAFEQTKKFSWENVAAQAVNALTTIANQSGLDDQSLVGGHAAISRTRQVTAMLAKQLTTEKKLTAMTLAAAEPYQPPSRLLVDVTVTAIEDHATGIQRVVKNISSELMRDHKNNVGLRVTLGYCDSSDGFFEAHIDANGTLSSKKNTHHTPIPFGRGGHLLMLDSSWQFLAAHEHIFTQARLADNEITSVLYDLVPLQVPAFCHEGMPPVFSTWLKSALAQSTNFICISKAVADDLFKLLHAIKFNRQLNIGYWHLGADLESDHTATNCNHVNGDAPPTFLMVGTLEPRKGHKIALDAFTQLWDSNFAGRLVIAGKIGWGVDHLIERIRNHPQLSNKLFWHESPSDADLQKLYASCDALIAASFAEGFGLPIVEAAHHNKPVIASDIAVFREIAGSASANSFFEPGSPSSLANRITEFVNRKNDGPREATATTDWLSWAESARQLVEVVLDHKWYRTYIPRNYIDARGDAPIWILDATQALPPEERLFSLTLIDGPIISTTNNTLQFVIKIRNLSATYWSSSSIDGTLAVRLSYHILGRNSKILDYDGPRINFPFGIPAHSDHYAIATIDATWLLKGMKAIEFELVQEGVCWWGSPLHVDVDIG